MIKFKVGDIVKFASCGPTYNKRTCLKCKSCIANAYDLVDSKEKNGSLQYVHGQITGITSKQNRRGKTTTVRVRYAAPRSKYGDLLDVSHSVIVPMWLLRPSIKKLQFARKKNNKEDIFNPFSLI